MSVLTKIFIVLQLVFSLALAVLVTFTLSTQPKYRSMVESSQVAQVAAAAEVTRLQNNLTSVQGRFEAAVNDRAKDASTFQDQISDLRTQLATLTRERDRIAGEAATDKSNLTAAVLTTNALTDQVKSRDTELATNRPLVLKLAQENAEVNRVNASLQSQLDAANKAIRTLQEAIASAPAPTTSGSTGASLSENQTASLSAANAPVNGKVTGVQSFQGRTYVTLSLGTRDKVAENTRFTIYRNNSYVGDAVVTKATVDQSVAVVTLTKPGQAVQSDDMVITGAGF